MAAWRVYLLQAEWGVLSGTCVVPSDPGTEAEADRVSIFVYGCRVTNKRFLRWFKNAIVL